MRRAGIERAKRKRPENLNAFDLYLQALPHTHASTDRALALLSRALDLEPDFAAARATAAFKYDNRYMRGGLREEDKATARHHARAAIAAGADDATTLATAGFVIGLVDHDYETAMDAIDHALTLTTASTWALGSGAVILVHAGDAAQGIDYAERAIRLNPRNPEIWHACTGLAIAHCAGCNWEPIGAAHGSRRRSLRRPSPI